MINDPHYCPEKAAHTRCPDGYINWHSWAARMSKTHKQRRCKGCGFWTIWEPRPQPKALAGEGKP